MIVRAPKKTPKPSLSNPSIKCQLLGQQVTCLFFWVRSYRFDSVVPFSGWGMGRRAWGEQRERESERGEGAHHRSSPWHRCSVIRRWYRTITRLRLSMKNGQQKVSFNSKKKLPMSTFFGVESALWCSVAIKRPWVALCGVNIALTSHQTTKDAREDSLTSIRIEPAITHTLNHSVMVQWKSWKGLNGRLPETVSRLPVLPPSWTFSTKDRRWSKKPQRRIHLRSITRARCCISTTNSHHWVSMATVTTPIRNRFNQNQTKGPRHIKSHSKCWTKIIETRPLWSSDRAEFQHV